MSNVKLRRRQDLVKIQFSLAKAALSLVPLLPEYFGNYFNLIENPQETTRYITGLVVALDVCLFRFLFIEDLNPRKGQAGNRNANWSGPTAALYMIASVIVFFIAIILFGAPFLESWIETIHLALMLATFCFGPFCYVFAQPLDEILKLLQSEKADFVTLERACLLPGLMAIAGAWCGTVVIPLDWDRPWQKWPIPCLYGALVGYFLSNFVWSLALSWKFFRRPAQKFVPKGE